MKRFLKELEEAKQGREQSESESQSLREEIKRRDLRAELVRGVKDRGVHEDLTVALLEREVDYDETGTMIFRRDGQVLEDKNQNPLTLEERLKVLTKDHPAIAVGSSGGGAPGGRAVGGKKLTPEQFLALPASKQAESMYRT